MRTAAIIPRVWKKGVDSVMQVWLFAFGIAGITNGANYIIATYCFKPMHIDGIEMRIIMESPFGSHYNHIVARYFIIAISYHHTIHCGFNRGALFSKNIHALVHHTAPQG